MKGTRGSDHAGFELKQVLIDHLKQSGHELIDVGTNSTQPVDYPDFAEALALSLLHGDSERGILICGSGVGASLAGHKNPRTPARNFPDRHFPPPGVEDVDGNVLRFCARPM